jgi:hypothetical protein
MHAEHNFWRSGNGGSTDSQSAYIDDTAAFSRFKSSYFPEFPSVLFKTLPTLVLDIVDRLEAGVEEQATTELKKKAMECLQMFGSAVATKNLTDQNASKFKHLTPNVAMEIGLRAMPERISSLLKKVMPELKGAASSSAVLINGDGDGQSSPDTPEII